MTSILSKFRNTLDTLDTLDQTMIVKEKQRSALDPPRSTPDHRSAFVTDITFHSPSTKMAVWHGRMFGYRGSRWTEALRFERDVIKTLTRHVSRSAT